MSQTFKYKNFIYSLDGSNHKVETLPKTLEPESVFKYYSNSKYSIDALKRSYLFATHPYSFNDSIDSSALLLNVENVTYERFVGFYKRFFTPEEFDKYDFKQMFEEDKKNSFSGFRSFCHQVFSRNFGLISLTTNPLNILMWSHYSSEDGFMIELDTKVLLDNIVGYNDDVRTYLITHYGDVPFYENELTIEQSFEISRTDKEDILQMIYEYYDYAIANLPGTYAETEFATKGAAYALKARAALYLGDFETAAAAAKGCIDLEAYKLHPDFAELFLPSTKDSDEVIFKIPRSKEFNEVEYSSILKSMLPRIFGGHANTQPTWQLLASFECVDGLPIDESPLFDPRNPFKNRDPRLAMTIIPFGSLIDGDGKEPDDGSIFFGVEFTPHPEHKQVMDFRSGKLIKNLDTRSVVQWASFNGLYWKKSISEDWLDYNSDPDVHIIRYADVLLMYAEAKIELNEIDESVLKAINSVRERAYANSPHSNPVVTSTDQSELRYIVRNERRAEFALEGLRYFDLIRWKLAEAAISGNIYGTVNVDSNADVNVPPTGKLMEDVVEPGLWFWGLTPEIDENGLPQFENLLSAGLARVLNTMYFPERQYLWPIPQDEILLNTNLTQNPGY